MSTASWVPPKHGRSCQNLNAALVIGRNTHIHVPEKRVVSDTRTHLPVDSGQHALSGSGTFLESPWGKRRGGVPSDQEVRGTRCIEPQ